MTVSFHNFKSQNFKLSVSNPKNKYVAYLSVLSQISNCQSLGRKNKPDISKTDRIIVTVVSMINSIIIMIMSMSMSMNESIITIISYDDDDDTGGDDDDD